jgi:hypothetical protein
MEEQMLNFEKVAVGGNHPSITEKHASHEPLVTGVNGTDPSAKKKVRSEEQREASRRNGRNGHGPNDTRRTKYNARKNGFRSEGLTSWDDAQEYESNVTALKAKYSSSDSDPFVRFMIGRVALGMVRCARAAQLDANNIIAMCDDGNLQEGTPVIHPGVLKEYGETSIGLLQRYETASENSVIRARRELERIAPEESTVTGEEVDPLTGNVTI